MATTRFSSKPVKKAEWRIFAEFQREGILTDSIIRGCDSDEEFKVHKLVLCASSPFLRESILDEGITYITINFITSSILRYILDYVYNGEAEVKTEEVSSFVNAASLLELEGFLSKNGSTQQTTNKHNILSNNIPILLDSDEEDVPIVNNIFSSSAAAEITSFVESDNDVIFIDSPESLPRNEFISTSSNLRNPPVENESDDDDVVIVDMEERQFNKNSSRTINGVSRKRKFEKTSCEHERMNDKQFRRPKKRLPRRAQDHKGKSGETDLVVQKCQETKKGRNEGTCENPSQKPGTSNTFYNIPKSPVNKLNISKIPKSIEEDTNRPLFIKRVLFPNRTLKHFTPKSV